MARFDSVLSFTRDDQPAPNDKEEVAYDNSDDDAGFEFAFAPPLTAAGAEDAHQLAPADDLFAHGRILPAYPVFDRHHLKATNGDELARPQESSSSSQAAASTAPHSPDSYCAWAPRSAPGSPAREFPKSASTGEARRFWRLRDLVAGRSHSDGKEKFLFLQPTGTSSSNNFKQAKKPSSPAAAAPQHQQQHHHQQQLKQHKQQSKKKGGVAEMDMATAHKLFYGGNHQGATAGERRHHSFLPYRGFFATAQALGRSHHPY
ncbi:hypothetical protein PR202_ga06387 [Eleusine coracana subsp. coracana]|uniref:Uncharacterized protein n=1 Tax=Eleusine coracana subsp. coracana TaxID=191504 RepID=A0AAV5BUW7_ELECO|nr:hypothetical protein PR202_ga06387 [Eleusine coracana subsp. coracana]